MSKLAAALDRWLKPLDGAAVECDGMTRGISTLLERDDVPYCAHVGRLTVAGANPIPLHCWITIENQASPLVIDFRARMWIPDRDGIQHGVFIPNEATIYSSEGTFDALLDPGVFEILMGHSFDGYPRFAAPHLIEVDLRL